MSNMTKLVVTMGLLFLVIVMLIVAAVFVSIAAHRLDKTEGRKKDPHLNDARTQLVWAAVVGWFSAVILCVLVGVYFFFGSELMLTFIGKMMDYALLGLAVALTATCGILAAIAADNMNKSGNQDVKQNGAYKDAIIAASVALGGSGIVLFALAFHLFYHPKTESEKTQDLIKEEKKIKIERAKRNIKEQKDELKHEKYEGHSK